MATDGSDDGTEIGLVLQTRGGCVGHDGAALSPEVVHEHQLIHVRVDTCEEYRPTVAARGEAAGPVHRAHYHAQIGGHRRRLRRGEIEVTQPGIDTRLRY